MLTGSYKHRGPVFPPWCRGLGRHVSMKPEVYGWRVAYAGTGSRLCGTDGDDPKEKGRALNVTCVPRTNGAVTCAPRAGLWRHRLMVQVGPANSGRVMVFAG